MVFDYTCKSNLDFLQNLRKQSNLPALTHENSKYKKIYICAVIKPITGHHGLHDLLAQLLTQSIFSDFLIFSDFRIPSIRCSKVKAERFFGGILFHSWFINR